MNTFLRMPVVYCIAGIVLAVWFESVRAGWWGLLFLGGLISLYAFLAKGEKDGCRFQTGDNCYFIGFVYTLSIITLSLILDAETLVGGLGEQNLLPLLKTIGIALGTSVIGMICRFSLTHGIRVGEDAFDDAVRDAAVAAASLTGVVGEAAKAAVPLKSAVEDLRRTIGNTSEAMQAQSQAGATGLKRLFDAYRGRLEAAFTETNASLQALATGAAENFRQQRSSLNQDAKDVLRELQEKTRAHDETIQASLGDVTSSLTEYVRAVSGSARRVGETLDKAAGQAVARVEKEITDALQANDFADAQQELRASVQTHREVVGGLNQTLAKAMDSLTEASTAVVARADEARNALAAIDGIALHQELVAVTQAIHQFRTEVVALTGQLSSLASGQLAVTNPAGNYNQQPRPPDVPHPGTGPTAQGEGQRRSRGIWPWR